ncbi:prepilin-type N-terminal cleavage/methylation domain-containing protein [Synechococcus sp. HK01-R]|uniref:pilin n=1 Tax=Synechococcus sp. HK01-R TaxID=2751171 RepID=UPI001629C82C|nr:prepilin-type N-terminal cleavage/methylation domain-containing protein [Synechococcus sp. HK01-R]QNG27082.1 prepilin-type N-terminal cleavage/methylation domain-containing protein [Synechococcus sp. HK01-R]
MTSLNSRLQLALLNRKKGRNALEKGFTLVELMIVIVIVGILSAVALPQFLGLSNKARIGSQIGEGTGLAKECSTAIIAGGPYPANYGTFNSGLTVAQNCNGGDTATAPAANVTYVSTAATAETAGVTCGSASLTNGQTCTITVNNATGAVSYTAG